LADRKRVDALLGLLVWSAWIGSHVHADERDRSCGIHDTTAILDDLRRFFARWILLVVRLIAHRIDGAIHAVELFRLARMKRLFVNSIVPAHILDLLHRISIFEV